MKFDKFTLKAQEALATAQQLAMAKSNMVLSPLHLLSAILSDDEGLAVMALKKIGANIERIKEMTESELNRLPQGQAGPITTRTTRLPGRSQCASALASGAKRACRAASSLCSASACAQ